MRLLFTKNHNVGSKLIMWGTEGDCSHFAAEFDECLVLQSNMLQGVNLTSTNEFMNHNEIVHELKFELPLDMEEAVYQPLVKRLAGKTEYDRKAMCYWALCVINHRITGAPIPEVNKWGDPKKFMCIEVAEQLPDFLFGNYRPDNLKFTSPTTLFHIIDERTKDSPYRV